MGSNVVWEITFKNGVTNLMIVSPHRDKFKVVENYFAILGNLSLVTGIKRLGSITHDYSGEELD